MTKKTVAAAVPPAKQLDGFMTRFSPSMAKLTKAVLKMMRERLPGAVELIYDKANALAIGFGPDERAGHAINSIAVYSNWINLYFFEGDSLPDREGLLKGTGVDGAASRDCE